MRVTRAAPALLLVLSFLAPATARVVDFLAADYVGLEPEVLDVRFVATEQAADARCARHVGWTPLMIITADFVPLLRNWLRTVRANVASADVLVECVVFVALDSISFEYLAIEANVTRFSTWDTTGRSWYADESSTLSYGQDAYFALMLERLQLIDALLSQNVSVAVIEADQILFRDPFRIVNALEAGRQHDFVTYDDSRLQNERLPCFGFLFVRANTRALRVWAQLIDRMKARPGNEQLLMVGLMRTTPVSVRFLPAKYFKNGAFLASWSATAPPALAFAHVNWLVGIDKKIKMLRRLGWWASADS